MEAQLLCAKSPQMLLLIGTGPIIIPDRKKEMEKRELSRFSPCSHVQKNKSWRNSLWCIVQMPCLWVNRMPERIKGTQHQVTEKWLRLSSHWPQCIAVASAPSPWNMHVPPQGDMGARRPVLRPAVLEQISYLLSLSHLPSAELFGTSGLSCPCNESIEMEIWSSQSRLYGFWKSDL